MKRNEEVAAFVYDGKIEGEKVEIFYGNILNKDSLKKAVDKADVIYHLAAVVDYLAPRNLMFNVNVLGTKNLMELSKGKKVIYLSSTAVMGRNFKQLPADEKTSCNPSNYYGWTKLQAEKIVKENNGIIIRSADVFGPGFTEGYNYIISKLEDETLPIIGDGKNFIQWIHIDDLVQALILTKENGKPGEVYIVAGKEVKTLKECWNLLCKHLGVEPPKRQISKFAAKTLSFFDLFGSKIKGKRPDVIPEYIDKITSNRTFDISKAKRELEFEPKIGYEQAAREMVEEYKKLKEEEDKVAEKQGEQES